MIKKINKLNNASCFSFFDWDLINKFDFTNRDNSIEARDGHFLKNNILFGENGNGKSKLVEVFKSVNGEPCLIEKHRDKSKDDQEIELILNDDSRITFNGEMWSGDCLKNRFIIFDKHFTDTFVHSTGIKVDDTAHRRQQRGKNIIYLGKFDEYNREIDRLNSLRQEISERNDRFINSENQKIESLLTSGGLSLESVLNDKHVIVELDAKLISEKEKELTQQKEELTSLKEALNKKDKIQDLQILLEIKKSVSFTVQIEEEGIKRDIKLDPRSLFSFTLTSGIQETLHKITHKKEFIKSGVLLLSDQEVICPFCEQKIKNGEYLKIIKDYQEIFDEELSKKENSVRKQLNLYKKCLEAVRDLRTPSVNQSRLDVVKKFITIKETFPAVELPVEDMQLVISEIESVLNKENKILDKIDDSKIEQLEVLIGSLNEKISVYDSFVKKINERISQLKKDIEEGKLEEKIKETTKAVGNIEKQIFYLRNKKQLEDYFKALKIFDKNKEVIQSLERIYQVLKLKIVEKFNSFVEEYFGLIKGFVKEISPSMEILDICGEANYDRRNIEPAKCGFKIEYNDKEVSRSLSEGEKQVIALAYFFALLRKEPIKNKIIVLDDPITSFDAGKRKSTAEVIEREVSDFEQLFVFTCDPLFREYCLKQFNNRNFYYIFKTRGSSSIHYAYKDRETIYNSFESEFKKIEDMEGSNENVVIFGQKLRFCLETKIKEDYFGYSEDNLSNMIHKVTSRNKIEFEKLFDNRDKILQIYNYCNTGGLAHYPRDGSTSWNELKGKINEYLSLNL